MLSIPHTHTHMNIRHNCGDGITGVCICPNSSNIIYWVFYINYAIIKLVKKRILRQLIQKTEFKFICKVFHSPTLQPLHTYLITSFLCPFSHFVSLALSHAQFSLPPHFCMEQSHLFLADEYSCPLLYQSKSQTSKASSWPCVRSCFFMLQCNAFYSSMIALIIVILVRSS